LIERSFKVTFEDNFCFIRDVVGQNVFKVKIKGKSFALNLLEEKQVAFPIKENTHKFGRRNLGIITTKDCCK